MSTSKSRGMLGGLVVAIVGLLIIALPGAAAARDRNHDRIPDRWERHHHLSLHKNQAKRDQDRDALRNRQEWKAGDDPRDPGSDNDGVEDGDEGAGTIASFADHVLTIDLFGGGSVSGLVTEGTEVKCDHGDDQGDEDGDHEGGHHGDTGDGEHAVTKASSEDEPGDHEGEAEDDDNHACSADHLVAGAVVQEADLKLGHGEAVFEEIELAE
jgi:hypothetical protein